MADMIEVKTADLIGAALDWAVAKVEAVEVFISGSTSLACWLSDKPKQLYSPSTRWRQGGRLIQKHGVLLTPPNDLVHRNYGPFDPRNGWDESGHWGGTIPGRERKYRRACFSHPTEPLVVAMRAIVQFGLGDVVQVPAELVQGGAA